MDESISELHNVTGRLISSTETVLVVGDPNCQFNTIVQILEPDNSINFDRKLIDIAIDLNISAGTIAHWRRGITFGNLSNDVLLYELLKEFRCKYASDATLKKFMHALSKKDLLQEAVNLGNHFEMDFKPNKKFKQTVTQRYSLAKWAFSALLLIPLCVIGATYLIRSLQKQRNPALGFRLSTRSIDEVNHIVYKWTNSIEITNTEEIQDMLPNCVLSPNSRVVFSDSHTYSGTLINLPTFLKLIREIRSPSYSIRL